MLLSKDAGITCLLGEPREMWVNLSSKSVIDTFCSASYWKKPAVSTLLEKQRVVKSKYRLNLFALFLFEQLCLMLHLFGAAFAVFVFLNSHMLR